MHRSIKYLEVYMNIDKFLKIECKYDLFNKEINGIRYWVYYRTILWNFRILAQSAGLDLSKFKKRKLSDRLRKYKYLLKNITFPSDIDVLFINHERRIKKDKWFECIYTDELCKRFKSAVIELPFEDKHFQPVKTKNLIYIDSILARFMIYSRIRRIYNSSERNDIIYKLKIQLNEAFGELNEYYDYKVEDKIFNEICDIIFLLSYVKEKYRKILLKINPKILVEIVSYDPLKMLFTEVAKEEKIPVIELQHGVVYKEHAAYNFLCENIVQFPDKMFVFSEFWKKNIRAPIADKDIIPVGYPYLEEKINLYRGIERQDKRYTILFISQWTIGIYLSKVAKELSVKLPIEKFRIIFKLHPGEYSDWQNKYTDLIGSNIEIIDNNEESIYKFFSESDMQIGVYSTAIYEGLAFNLNTLILRVGQYEIMNILVDSGYAKFIDSSDDVVECINKYSNYDNKNDVCCRDVGDFWMTNSLDNITREINKILTDR